MMSFLKTNKYWAVIAAGGNGSRMAQQQAKQFLPLAGKAMLSHSLELFCQHPAIDGVVVASRDEAQCRAISHADFYWCEAGDSRADTVYQALCTIAAIDGMDNNTPTVLVHDAARPCLSLHDLNQCLDALEQQPGKAFILANQASDSIKQSSQKQSNKEQPNKEQPNKEQPNMISQSLPRENIWLAGTPQCAPLYDLKHAMERHMPSITNHKQAMTDEAGYLTLDAIPVQLLQARDCNMKVTWPEDLLMAAAVLQAR